MPILLVSLFQLSLFKKDWDTMTRNGTITSKIDLEMMAVKAFLQADYYKVVRVTLNKVEEIKPKVQ